MNRTALLSGSPRNAAIAASSPGRPRLTWLDFFRGAAVLVMIETHVVNTFLAVGLREAGWFASLNYINGLVAPSFLFIAGFVQGMERRKSPAKPIQYSRRAGRLLGIVVLGYALHFPVTELVEHRWADALRIGSQVDVLQCLGLGLGLLLGVSWLAGKFAAQRSALVWSLSVAALAVAAILVAPSAQAWTSGPMALRSWMNASTGSLFPILPWLGFVFFGALMGAMRPERSAAQRLAAVAGLAALAWACRDAVFSAVSPSFFLERAAWVLVLATLCEWTSHRMLFPKVVIFTGQHSLKFYVVHLALITALVGLGAPSAFLGWPHVLALLAGVLAMTLGVAWVLDRVPQFVRAARWRVEPEIEVSESSPGVAS